TRLEKALASSVATPPIRPRGADSKRRSSVLPNAAATERASYSHCASKGATWVHSPAPGKGLPSRRDSVSKSLTNVYIRCTCRAISCRYQRCSYCVGLR
ncbi:MAG: hypothetical protein ACD_23C00472G0002, partial [uncultured bacterium]